tara:strand:+ start:5903 stop:6571 length:669 start_codon:yes stop_codon:yes gene_type:complete
MKNTLEIDGVILEFKNQKILQDVYLECKTGKIAGLLGSNGTGKTCLMNIIYGNIKLVNSSVRINGKTFLKSYRDPETIKYLPQFSFIPNNLKVNRIFEDFQLDFQLDFLDFVNLFPDLEKQYNSRFSNLSGGEIRIIEIYCILASKTKFCMLDEPFSQVLPLHVESIKQLIIRKKQNKGILLSDHMYQHIINICDDVYIIKDRKVHLTKDTSDIVKFGYINS